MTRAIFLTFALFTSSLSFAENHNGQATFMHGGYGDTLVIYGGAAVQIYSLLTKSAGANGRFIKDGYGVNCYKTIAAEQSTYCTIPLNQEGVIDLITIP